MTHPDAAAWYPQMPPALDGEDDNAYTNRLLGIGGPSPYDHRRNRQCSIGWHGECSDRSGETCQCPCHRDEMVDLLSHAARVVAPWGGSVELAFTAAESPAERPTWSATLKPSASATSLLRFGGTPTEAMREVFRAAGWVD